MEEAEKFYVRGVEELEAGNGPVALSFFEKAAALDVSPKITSFLGLCLAHERGQVQKGQTLCGDAITKEPTNPIHYLNLGKIYLLVSNRTEAIRVFRDGLRATHDERLVTALNDLGTRKPPVLPFLLRDHFLNKYLGKLLNKLGLR